eukprot:tig00020610_g11963.t1
MALARAAARLADPSLGLHARVEVARALHGSRRVSAGGPPPAGSGVPQVFDRELVRRQRSRAAALARSDPDGPRRYDYLFEEVARRLIDKLEDCKGKFPTAIELGARSGHLTRELMRTGAGGVQRMLLTDLSEEMLHKDDDLPPEDFPHKFELERRVADEELLPFEPGSADAVFANLSLHWVNDLPGALIQARRTLRPDGLFLGALLGGDTLHELRVSLSLAEQEREGGVSTRISPFAGVRDAGNLLSRAGFAMPAVDSDELVIDYPSPLELMYHLRRMGETNAVRMRRGALRPDVMHAAAAIYREMFGNADGTVPATFQVVYMLGWSPDSSQPQAKERGSAQLSLKDLPADFKMTPLEEDPGAPDEKR